MENTMLRQFSLGLIVLLTILSHLVSIILRYGALVKGTLKGYRIGLTILLVGIVVIIFLYNDTSSAGFDRANRNWATYGTYFGLLILLVFSVWTLFKTHKRIITGYHTTGSMISDFLLLIKTGKPSSVYKKLEFVMLLRNKQPRKVLLVSTLYMSGLLYFYYKTVFNHIPNDPTFLMLFAFVLPQLIYGKYFVAWYGDSIHFLMSRPVKWSDLMNHQSQLLTLLNVFTWLCLLPAAWVQFQQVWLSTAVLFYSLGINQLILLSWGLYVQKSLSPNNSNLVGSSNIKASEAAMILLLVVPPLAVYLALKTTISANAATFGLWAIGMAGILFRNHLLELITNAYNRKKYSLIKNLNIR